MSSIRPMNRSYDIQHDFLYQIAEKSNHIPDDLPMKKPEPTGIEFSFQKLTMMKSLKEFEDFVHQIPLNLFAPLLVIDYIPKSHTCFLMMNLFLFAMLLLFDRYGIHPEIAFADDKKVPPHKNKRRGFLFLKDTD